MTQESQAYVLSCRNPAESAPALTRVEARGRLDALLFELSLRQTYQNKSEHALEVVYTFPLPHQAVLLGFASELNGQRQVGRVVAKREAEQTYEQSLAEGDAPVMLEALGDGLHTANIGNLKPGDEIVLEVRYAQLLPFEQGRLRLAIPTTIAPRYGPAELAGLAPQQVPTASIDVEYPLALSLTVGAAMADAQIDCPTHRLTRSASEGELRLELAPGATMDRDVVVLLQPREARPSLVIQARDNANPSAPVVVMAALQPQAGTPRERIALKLLVDCSGSMGGNSIASARAALRGVVAGLGEGDEVSLSRFGSSVRHMLKPSAFSSKALREIAPLIDRIDADLGGTEMEAALSAVFALKTTANSGAADVLLITDGEIWQAASMIAAARQSGHRVFAIGVGSSPAEGVLRSLAEATGGACEFATPGEALEAAAQRMLYRMRQPLWREPRIDWGSTAPLWQSSVPLSVFGGDTVIAFAGFAAGVQTSAVRLMAQGEAPLELARGEASAPCPADGLARMAAARRLPDADATQALQLALDYQLMSSLTNCILVHEREDADKVAEEASLQVVPSMLAAGWGGVGAVMSSSIPAGGQRSRSKKVAPMAAAAPMRIHSIPKVDFDTMAPPLQLPVPASLEEVGRALLAYLAQHGHTAGLAHEAETTLSVHADLLEALGQAMALGLSADEAWLLLLHWVCGRNAALAQGDAAAVLQNGVAVFDATRVAQGLAVFQRLLGGYPLDGWTLSRMQRLKRKLSR